MPTPHQISLGKRGEDLACDELKRRGYEVIARGYRTRYGELDIIARLGALLVFVEVKARSDGRYGAPADAVTSLKQHKLCAMAAEYLAREGLGDVPCRFDVVAILTPSDGRRAIEVIPDAFRPGW